MTTALVRARRLHRLRVVAQVAQLAHDADQFVGGGACERPDRHGARERRALAARAVDDRLRQPFGRVVVGAFAAEHEPAGTVQPHVLVPPQLRAQAPPPTN